jgi:very-short-patch-repair endonuclease
LFTEEELANARSYCHGCGNGEWHAFRRGRAWRFDAAWPDRRLAVELEGGVHVRGRHVTGTGYEADLEKYATAAALGWRVLRFSAGQLGDGTATEIIELAWRTP